MPFRTGRRGLRKMMNNNILVSIVLGSLDLIYLKTQGDANWPGARCDHVEYDPRADCWVYTKNLEWRD